MNSIPKEKASRTFNNRFYIKKRISAGSFGVVFVCSDSVTQDYAALKVEKNQGDNLMSLDRETQILEGLQGMTGIPKIIWSGFEHGHNCIALQLLGKDLSYYLKQHKKFTLKCVCNIADQLINLTEQMHKRKVIHRDIKPENIITGRDKESNQLYLVDFGISKFYKEEGLNEHIPFKEGKPFIGTTRYASISSHKGYELSRRDDLESLGYVLVYMLKGLLPWQNVQSNNDKEKSKLVGQTKILVNHSELCKDLPIELQRYFDYVKKLTFKGSPDYKYLLQLVHKMAHSNGIIIDKKFDWIEQGTATTLDENQQSIDTLQRDFNNQSNFKVASQFAQNPQRARHQSHHTKKASNVDLSGSSLFSQGDFLKPPKKQRNDGRHSSMGDNQENQSDGSQKDSQQSSVAPNYVPSLYHKSIKSNSLLQSIRSKPGFSNHIRHESYQRVTTPKNSVKKSSTQKSIPVFENNFFQQQENFQDLEALEERLLQDGNVCHDYRSPKQRNSKKFIIVKQINVFQKENKERTVNSISNNQDDQSYINTLITDDDPGLAEKIKYLTMPIKNFKQNLSKQ